MKKALVLSLLLLFGCATARTPVTQPSEPVHIVIVGTTDVHGWFDGHTETPQGGGQPVKYGGVATFASYLNALRATNPGHVLLVDSGDMFQGTLESNLFEGEPVVRAYNALGYSAAAVGNHEFDYGPLGPRTIAVDPADDPLGALKRNAGLMTFPLLSANTFDKPAGTTPSWAKKYTMVTIDGARIGIIGITTPDTPNITVQLNVRNLTFGDPVAATVSAAKELRDLGADAIVVIAHMGGRCADVSNPNDATSCEPDHEVMRYLAALPPGTIDVYFAGHTHSQMRQFIKGVGVVQAWPYSSDFSTVDLWVDRDANRVVSDRTQLRPPTMICTAVYTGTERCDPSRAPKGATLVPRTFEGRLMLPDQSVAAVVQPYLERVAAKRNERLGVNTAAAFTRNSRAESSLGDIFADSMREAFATNFAFMNSGGLRQNLRAGELTYSDVFEVSPFDNYPAVVTLTGAQLIEILRITSTGDRGLQQVSGLRYTIDAAKDADKPVAERNRLITVTASDGTAIDPAALYTVVMPDFMIYGGEGIGAVMKTVPADRIKVWQDRTMRDVFAEMLKKRSQPIRPLTDGRITVLNAKPATGE